MKVLGITAEYNPFHNGHAYHIREAKARTGCDSVIVLMSGDFTERGLPACMDKYVRAEAALRCGADLVIELPVFSATAGAELFADGAVRAFQALGVDVVSYGVECDGNTDAELDATRNAIRKAAAFFAEEPDEYRTLLKASLAKGESFAKARWDAFITLCPEFSALSSTPNNILAIEYEKSILRRSVAFDGVPVRRIGKGYHDTGLSEFASATAIRGALSKQDLPAGTVPAELSQLYAERMPYLLGEDDFSLPLFSALHDRDADTLASYADISADLAGRIRTCAAQPFTWSSLAETVKERSHTRSHIDRALCHILLGITKEKQQKYAEGAVPPYLHVLGMRQSAAGLLGRLAEQSAAPLLVRLAKDVTMLPPASEELFRTELYASALYRNALFGKGLSCEDERKRKFLIIGSDK